MAKQSAPGTDAIDDPKGIKGKRKLVIIIAIGLLLAVGLSVGGTFWLMTGGAKGESGKSHEATTAGSAEKPAAIYQELMPAFVVNLKHKGRQRYMQVSVALMSRDQAALDGLKEHMPLLRNRLVMLFSGQDFATLVTPVGKEMLRQQATATVQELAQKETGKLAIEQVLFTNFVLQ